MSLRGNYVISAARRRTPVIPSGLIVPYDADTAPTGWTRYDSADGKYIVGAGDTYAVDDNGAKVSYSISSTTAGAHDGNTLINFTDTAAYNYSLMPDVRGALPDANSKSGGAHAHDITGDYSPKNREILLIKADSDHTSLPPKTVMLSTNTIAGLTQVYDDDRYFNSAAATASNAASYGTTQSSTGSHYHANTPTTVKWAQGAHATTLYSLGPAHATHVATDFSWEDKLKKVYMSAWSNASQYFLLQENMIAMYESLTPPTGWSLCNGANDTPDMRDFFFVTSTTENQGDTEGDNTIELTGSLASIAWTHDHTGGAGDGTDWISIYHTNYSATHSHTFTAASSAVMIPYYALAFIMYTG